jgi:membrane fusion protein, type I secretion system
MKDHRKVHDEVLERPRREPPRDVGPQGAALILELQRLRQAFERDDWNEERAPKPHRPPRHDARPAGPPRRSAPQPPSKSGMGRVIEMCLGPFGRNSSAPAARRTQPPQPQQPPPSRATLRQQPHAAPQPHGAPRPHAVPRPQPQAAPPLQPHATPPRQQPHVASPLQPHIAPRPQPQAAPPSQQRKQKPVTLVTPVAMDLSKPGPEIAELKPSARIEAPVRDQPRIASPPVPDTRVGQLIAQCRSGVAFLLSPNEPAREGDNLASATGRTFTLELKVGLRVLVAAIVLAGGWAALMPLAGAVVVPGNLVVQSNVKAIQHPTGGVVAEIPVRNGKRVNAGDLLLRLDATQAQASLQVISKQLDEFRARGARLVAERDGLARPDLPDELAPRLEEPGVKSLLSAEATLFQARANARESQKALLRSRIAQLNEEIGGHEAQVTSKVKQLELITGELAGVQDLYDKRLVPLPRLTALQREAARIEGERAQLISAIAETKAKIGEAQLQIVRTDQDFRTDVVKELGEVKGKEAELVERGVAARDLLDRIEMRSPVTGLVHQLNVHTIGGVIRAGDTIMEVVPDSDDLQIEARLQPTDIDQVRVGQKAFTRFPAFNQRVTPEVAGIVSFVSADISRDQSNNASYFTVRVTLPDEERRRLAGLQLVSGMPAEVFMQTGSRTMLSYLFKPITDQLQRAFVER